MRHRFHSICPYFAMFPESFVRRHLLSWSEPKDLILDPFSGRGTTALEALLNGRRAIGCDINPVAACISRAKTNPPKYDALRERISELEHDFLASGLAESSLVSNEFFEACFHQETLNELLFLRDRLRWRTESTDCFISALVLGSLHGESHRTAFCLSNRMPRTISTKPEYSVRWWRRNQCTAPRRKTFEVISSMAAYRFASPPPDLVGHVIESDVRQAGERFREYQGQVRLVITSPPYIDITNYREDQWLRLWFLGGPPRPEATHRNSDDRYRRAPDYWNFLEDAWRGIEPLLARSCQVIIRIGGTRLSRDELSRGLLSTFEASLGRAVRLAETHTSDIVQGQRRSFASRGTDSTQTEHDFRFVFTN
jgi:hypothetical protein